MPEHEPIVAMRDPFDLLAETGPGTPMGRLLRKFWQPVALSSDVAKGRAVPLRILSEDLTLYRGESGQPYLIDGRCAHRLTLLHTGWVEGEELRCIYHGWKYDGLGHCKERPAEEDVGPPRVKIAGYCLREYCGLIFAYMGEGPPPEFELPRKDVFERSNALVFPRIETWSCNWFQQVENSMDAVHVSFVHQAGLVGTFGQAVSANIPKLDYEETDAGIRQIATRATNVRVSNWTFPNNNHIVVPGPHPDDPWYDIGIWMVPVDHTHTIRISFIVVPPADEAARERAGRYFEEFGHYEPAQHHDELFGGVYPKDVLIQLTSAQDYVATIGQGVNADRSRERLGKSDRGVVFLRRLFWRELDCIREGRPTKAWRRLASSGELQVATAAPA